MALVYTLAIGEDVLGHDAYKEENERAMQAMQEAESVAVRSTTGLNPTEEDETADILRARLFQTIDARRSSSHGGRPRMLLLADRRHGFSILCGSKRGSNLIGIMRLCYRSNLEAGSLSFDSRQDTIP